MKKLIIPLTFLVAASNVSAYKVKIIDVANELPNVKLYIDSQSTTRINLTNKENERIKELNDLSKSIIVTISTYLNNRRYVTHIKDKELDLLLEKTKYVYYNGCDIIKKYHNRLDMYDKHALKMMKKKMFNLQFNWDATKITNEDATKVVVDILRVTKTMTSVLNSIE